ncbi:MAG TPA: Crp/Fnr family transcriptional regulator [Bacilli bacterium]
MLDFLSKVPLFKKLNQIQLQCIGNICVKKGVKEGSILFRENEPGEIFYILALGSIKIYTTHLTGEEKILSIFKPGDSFGELSLIDGKPRSATAQALEDSILFALGGANFYELLKANFDITLCIMQELAHRLRDTNQHVHDLTFLDARTRVIKNLIQMANKQGIRKGSLIVIKMALNFDELSLMAGVPKNVLMQVIRDFHERQILSISNTEFTLDLAKLKA